MKTRTITMLFALALAAHVLGEDAKMTVFGFAEGDVVPKSDRRADDVGEVLRTAIYLDRAGFDSVLVLYTENQGTCKVVGIVDVDSPGADSYGLRHKAAADGVADRVAAKLGRPHSEKHEFVTGGFAERNPEHWPIHKRQDNATYTFWWEDADATPFSSVIVSADYGYVRASFEYKNFVECLAVRDAADAAEF